MNCYLTEIWERDIRASFQLGHELSYELQLANLLCSFVRSGQGPSLRPGHLAPSSGAAAVQNCRQAVALSIMCDLPIGLIERALVQSKPEQLLVLAKAIDLSWETTKAVLTLQAGRGGLAKELLSQCFASFFRLQPKTAKNALQFYRLRERACERSVH